MSNEAVWKYLATAFAVSSGASMASNLFSASTDVVAIASANNSNYPLADLALFASFSTSISSNSNVVNVYRRDMDIDGTNDAPQPTSATATAYSIQYVGQFVVPPFSAASSGYFPLTNVPLSSACEIYVENKTNANMVAGWTVKYKPKTYGPL